MGIDLHNLNFLAHAADLGVSFRDTLAVGRQALFVDAPDLQRFRRRRGLPELPPQALASGAYFEPMLQAWFGCERPDAVDASDYEQARWVHDLNLPWPPQAAPSYDAVLDFGCLEHVFNFPTAWRSLVDRCKVGGHLLHALPANNLSGHGFYQFSPELFFNLYRPERGFELRGLYFALKADPRRWWAVANPITLRRRVNLCNAHEAYLLVLARKLREPGELPAPQQSDYAESEWLSPGPPPGTARPSPWQGRLDRLGLLPAARALRAWAQALSRSGLSLPAPDYQAVDVEALTRR